MGKTKKRILIALAIIIGLTVIPIGVGVTEGSCPDSPIYRRVDLALGGDWNIDTVEREQKARYQAELQRKAANGEATATQGCSYTVVYLKFIL